MAKSTPNDNIGTLSGAVAKLRRKTLSARIDVSRPDLGLHQLHLNGRVLPGHLLSVRRAETGSSAPPWPLPLADAYVRGNDLVARYTPTDDWPYSPQIYWSADSVTGIDGSLGSLSLLISVETHLLDTWPRISVNSRLASKELIHVITGDGEPARAESLTGDETLSPSIASCCLLMRLADLSISYAEVMPASDFRELRVSRNDDGHCRAEWSLFSDFLEKGVIRRARLQSVFLPRDNDVQLAAACCNALEHRPLPLTT